eukprot:jgi/Psemu1/37208/gm1.37208_g
MVSFILSFATSPLGNTKQAALHFADSRIPIHPPLPNTTVKFLCFPVTSSADGDPHYLFGAYVPGAHLLFWCSEHHDNPTA